MPTIVRKARTSSSTKTSVKPSASVSAGSAHSTADLYEKIRNRAYELYVQRGRLDGFAEQDWLQAESELRTARIA